MLAPNGSAIVFYGYDNGIRVIWRGGRSFLPPDKQKPAEELVETRNEPQKNDDAVMIVDSDEEEPAPPPPAPAVEEPQVQFEDEETEIDPKHPYEQILRHIDIPLGTKTLALAVPALLPEQSRSALDAVAPILTKRIVVAAVCADSMLRVVTLPLAPPHPSKADPSSWDIQIITMSATISNNEIPRGVSMTFTGHAEDSDEFRRSRSQRRSSHPRIEVNSWSLLVATHAAEASGSLLVYRVPVIQVTADKHSLSTSHLQPIQRHFLPSPAKSISFNPFPYPAERHSHLLVAFQDGYVKILSCLASKSRLRNAQSGNDEAAEPEGKWLISLYPGFEQAAPGTHGRRKDIVDAEWVLGGKAVMVLLADGEWGVWDVEGAGPGSEPGPLRGQSSVHGVTGGSLTAFAVSGRIVANPQSSKSHANNGNPTPPQQRTRFAPMTPSTRRVREDTLFKGQAPSTRSLTGEIAVAQINSSRSPLPDESILIRHGGEIARIPSLLSLWRNAVKSSGTFDASSRTRVTSLTNVSLLGERLTGISHLPAAARAEREGESRAFDILLTAEHRLIILAPQLTGAEPKKQAPTAAAEQQLHTDQLRLNRGELDVDGMDRLLDSFMSGTTYRPLQSSTQGRIFS